jgi:hypothetical protein
VSPNLSTSDFPAATATSLPPFLSPHLIRMSERQIPLPLHPLQRSDAGNRTTYGYQHKDGRRTCCPARNEVGDSRLRRNGFILEYYSYSHDEILQWMTRSHKSPPKHALPANLRGGGMSDFWGVALKMVDATPIYQGTSQKPPIAPMLSTKLTSNIAAAYEQGQAKRDELRRQYGMGSESAQRTSFSELPH